MFNTASKQHHEVWASQFPFLHGLKDVVPSSKACLYGHIKWSLAQSQQQPPMGLSQSFLSKKCGQARPWTGFHFTMKKWPVPGSSSASLAKRPHFERGTETQAVC